MAEAPSELELPSEPYIENSELTPAVVNFLTTTFDQFDEDGRKRLDKSGILSILIMGYPTQDVERLVKSTNTMLEMKLEIESLTYKHLLEINKSGAAKPEVFKNMLNNMHESFQKFGQIREFIKILGTTQLPVFKEEIEFLIKMREIEEQLKKPPVLTELNFQGVVEKMKEAKKNCSHGGSRHFDILRNS